MGKILEDAVVVGTATARTVSIAPWPEEGFACYSGSQWFNMLSVGGYKFLDPPPQITTEGVVPSPSDGARKLNARTAFFYPYTGINPPDVHAPDRHRLANIMAMRGGDGSSSTAAAASADPARTSRKAASGR